MVLRAGEGRGQSWTEGSSDPSEPWKGRKGPSRASLEGKEPASIWSKLHLPVNSQRREAKLRSEKVAGRQWGHMALPALCLASPQNGRLPLGSPDTSPTHQIRDEQPRWGRRRWDPEGGLNQERGSLNTEPADCEGPCLSAQLWTRLSGGLKLLFPLSPSISVWLFG